MADPPLQTNNRRFGRELGADAPAASLARQGRIAEPRITDPKGPQKGTAKTPYDIPSRPAVRGTLVERDNDDEFLEFHWNPTSYRIGKKATWTEKSVPKGHPTLEYAGVGLTKVSFELLLNNIGQPHVIDRNVEDSLQWLFDRLRPRTDTDSLNTGKAERNLPWLGIRDLKATVSPPILVLFGVSRPLICVLESVDIVTISQGQPPGQGRVRSNRVTLGLTSGGRALENLIGQGALDAAINLANEFDKISRATVSIKLKEYTNDPATESKEG